MSINCLICNNSKSVKFQDNYKLEIKEDKDYFKDAKIYKSPAKGLILKEIFYED